MSIQATEPDAIQKLLDEWGNKIPLNYTVQSVSIPIQVNTELLVAQEENRQMRGQLALLTPGRSTTLLEKAEKATRHEAFLRAELVKYHKLMNVLFGDPAARTGGVYTIPTSVFVKACHDLDIQMFPFLSRPNVAWMDLSETEVMGMWVNEEITEGVAAHLLMLDRIGVRQLRAQLLRELW